MEQMDQIPSPSRSKWTDSKIENDLREITVSLGHFPSDPDLQKMGRGDLSNAVNKRGGIISWSERLGLPRVHSDSDTGWDGEKAVQTILESKGFGIERSSAVKAPYDLLINGNVRCDVKTAKQATYNLNTGKPWSAWFYRIGKAVQSDIVILYRSDLNDCFVLPWKEVGTTNITISPSSPKYGKFKDRFDIIESYDRAIKSIVY